MRGWFSTTPRLTRTSRESVGMAITYRKRGKIWHVRGSIRIGRRVIKMREFSTGCSSKPEAEAIAAAEEARLRADAFAGLEPQKKRTFTVGECIATYEARPGGLHPFDQSRLIALKAAMGATQVADVRAAWSEWLRTRGEGLAPSTVARWRSTLRAALAYGADEFGVSVPPLRAIRNSEVERIAYLQEAQQERLLSAYSPWAAPVMLILCHTGMRTQEALQLDWRCIDWDRNVIMIEHAGRVDGPRTKSKKSRRVGMRPIVRERLIAMWKDQNKPEGGRVFRSRRGQPYADTRNVGGNPLSSAHRTACKSIGLKGFRIHDWRHHFAVWFLKNGGNLRALCQIAGWSSMRMVQRYAVFEQSDLDDLMLKTAGTRPPICPPNAPGTGTRNDNGDPKVAAEVE